MSFAADAKTELCRTKLARTCCAQAEVCGVLLYCNQFSPRQVRVIIRRLCPAPAPAVPQSLRHPL